MHRVLVEIPADLYRRLITNAKYSCTEKKCVRFLLSIQQGETKYFTHALTYCE